MLLLGLRFGVLALVAALVALRGEDHLHVPLSILAVIAVIASIPLPRRYARFVPLAEGVAVSILIGQIAPLPEPLLPYLVVPAIAAGLTAEVPAVVITTGLMFLGVTAARISAGTLSDRSASLLILQWLTLAVAVGLLASWVRIGQRRAETHASYADAHELLLRLRGITRALPTGLDEVSLAQQLLANVRDSADFRVGALYTRTESGAVVPLTVLGDDRIDWPIDAQAPAVMRALSSRSPVVTGSTFAGNAGASAVFPVTLGQRQLGVVAIENEDGWDRASIRSAQALIDDTALRMDTASLFSEVRALATVEERRRVAREIHDGIAQDIASLGYAVDDLAARSTDPETRADLGRVRNELTRMVTELRLSIFDLRSDVAPATGLGAALSSYVRGVGTDSELTVHLVLDESNTRLSIETESEILRIAQEAVTNARKHSQARNLWVTCRVDPPRAFLRIADDGKGLGKGRSDSYGMEIMRERATRIGGDLSIRQRVGGGTVVEVVLGPNGAMIHRGG